MSLLLGALTVGLILALVSLGVFLSFRVLRSLDLTTDGTFTTGAAVMGAVLMAGGGPLLATIAGGVAGMLCGALTGFIHTRWRVDVILAGILVATALYSVDIWVMRGGNLSLSGHPTLFDEVASLLGGLPPDPVTLVVLLLLVFGIGFFFATFAVTDLGLALRATGSSPRMAKAMAIDTGLATTIGLALANGCIGLSGALFAQYQGFVNIQMGIGMIVTGLASVILGEALYSQRNIRRKILASLLGAITFRLLIAVALRAGMDPNALKLVTAIFVLAALTLPKVFRRFSAPRARPAHG
ncbi:MAG: ABC transporter permease [Gemmatimonadales bacterium]